MTTKDYMEQTGFVFVLSHNPGDYPQIMGSAQEQALGTEKIRPKQASFRKYIAVGGAFNKQIITSVEPVFLSPLVDQLTNFGQVTALTILQHIFSRYGEIEEIGIEENAVKIIGPYNPTEPLVRLIEQL